MNFKAITKLGELILDAFWQSCEVKKYVISLLEKYAASSDNDLDNIVVEVVKIRLLTNCK